MSIPTKLMKLMRLIINYRKFINLSPNPIDLHTATQVNLIAVYIDSLVMISIEKSEINKKRALEIRDKFVLDHDKH